MKKETVIAVSLGILLGVIVAVVMVAKTRQQQAKKVKPITNTVRITPTIPVHTPIAQSFEVSQPENGVITDKKTITLKGKATKGGLLVVQSPAKNTVIKTEKEDFSVDFPLVDGENVILVSFYSPDYSGTPQEKELKIYSLVE